MRNTSGQNTGAVFQGSLSISLFLPKGPDRRVIRRLGPLFICKKLDVDEKGLKLKDEVLRIAKEVGVEVHTTIETVRGKSHYPYYIRTGHPAKYHIYHRSGVYLGPIEDIYKLKGYHASSSFPGLFVGEESVMAYSYRFHAIWRIGDMVYDLSFIPDDSHLKYLDACASKLPEWATMLDLYNAVPVNKRGSEVIVGKNGARLSAIRYIRHEGFTRKN